MVSMACLVFMANAKAGVVAEVIIGNLSTFPTPTPSNYTVGYDGVSSVYSIAYGFTMGAQSYSVGSVVLRLQGYDTAAVAADARIGIFTNDGVQPGSTLIGSYLTNPAFAPGENDFTFTAVNVTLAAGTRYWLVASAENTSLFAWAAGGGISAPSGIGATDYGTQLNDGSGWSSENGSWTAFEINAVPEPSTWAFTLFGLAALTAFLKRRPAQA